MGVWERLNHWSSADRTGQKGALAMLAGHFGHALSNEMAEIAGLDSDGLDSDGSDNDRSDTNGRIFQPYCYQATYYD